MLDGGGYEVGGSADEDHDANVENSCVKTLIDMDIDYPESIVNRVNEVLEQLRQSDTNVEYVVDVIGHGAAKYAQFGRSRFIDNWPVCCSAIHNPAIINIEQIRACRRAEFLTDRLLAPRSPAEQVSFQSGP